MKNVKVEFSPHQAEDLVHQLIDNLDLPAKLRLAKKLDQQTRKARWEPLVEKMQENFAERPLTAQEIRHLCEQVREERFNRAARRR